MGASRQVCTIQRTAQFRGLRADSIRPYSSGGEAAAIHRTAQLRTLREAKSLPYRTQKLSVFSVYVTGRVREPTYRYKPPCGIIRRHCRPAQKLSVFSVYVTGRVREPTYRYKPRAALSGGTAAPLCISFREAWPRLVFFTFTGYNALVTFLKGAFRCKQKKMK